MVASTSLSDRSLLIEVTLSESLVINAAPTR